MFDFLSPSPSNPHILHRHSPPQPKTKHGNTLAALGTPYHQSGTSTDKPSHTLPPSPSSLSPSPLSPSLSSRLGNTHLAEPFNVSPLQLSIPKFVSHATITKTNSTHDFHQFFSAVQSQDQSDRDDVAGSFKPNTKSATDSLKRVASSSVLNHLGSQRHPDPFLSPNTLPHSHSTVTLGRRRKDSLHSLASTRRKPPSTISSSYKNPASLFVEQRSSQIHGPEIGIEQVSVYARNPDRKNLLTAHQRQNTASESDPTFNAKGKARAIPGLPSYSTLSTSPSFRIGLAARSGLSAVDQGTGSSRAAPSSTLELPGASSLDPNRSTDRAQTTSHNSLVKPRRPDSAATAVKQIEPKSTAPPKSSSTMPKRRLEESDDQLDNLSHGVGKANNSLGIQNLSSRNGSSPSTRRKTWFGRRGLETQEEQQKPSLETGIVEPTDPQPTQHTGNQGMPPPALNEQEAAFRRALGIHTEFGSPNGTASDDMQHDSFPSQDHDINATLRPNHVDKANTTTRRMTWLPWHFNYDTNNDNTTDVQTHAPENKETNSRSTSDTHRKYLATNTDKVPPKPRESLNVDSFSSTADSSSQVTTSQVPTITPSTEDSGTIKVKTIKKRGWFGREYQVEAPIQPVGVPEDCVADKPKQQDPTPFPPAAAQILPQDNVGESSSLNNPVTDTLTLAGNGADLLSTQPQKQESEGQSGWMWLLWGGATPSSADAHPTDQNNDNGDDPQEPPSSSTNLATNSQTPQLTANEMVNYLSPAVAMDVDRQPTSRIVPSDGTAASSTYSSSMPRAYSSYLSSWVPAWVYNPQQDQQTEHCAENMSTEQNPNDGLQQGLPNDDRDSSESAPPTPAQQVKADALARAGAAISPIIDPGKVVLNQTTRSGWVNYFSSRSAKPAKQIEAALTKTEDGMEVMDISDMEASPPTQQNATLAMPVPAQPKSIIKKARSLISLGGGGGGVGGVSSSWGGKNSRASTPAPTIPMAKNSAVHFGDAANSSSKPGSTHSGNPRSVQTPISTSKESVGILGKSLTSKPQSNTKAKPTDPDTASVAGQGATNERGYLTPEDANTQNGRNTPTESDPARPSLNLVLPSFEDTFSRPPRAWPPKVGVLERTLSVVNNYLFSKVPDLERMKRPTRYSTYTDASDANSIGGGTNGSHRATKSGQHLAGRAKATGKGSSKDKGKEAVLKEVAETAQRLPRAFVTLAQHEKSQTRGCAGIRKIVVIGVHGWFTQSIFKSWIGEPTGTSLKFAKMQAESIRRHFAETGFELDPNAITMISLQGDGKVTDRVDRLFSELISRPHWVKDLAEADGLFLSAHSQGAIVATQLLARLIEQRQVQADRTRICLLSMCGIHHGPFASLKTTITSSYINYFETAAAKELFEFQSSSHPASQQYTAGLKIILDAGVKCVYVGSTDDNVVPLYSALNSSNNHPSILRALYIDGQAFPKVDFLTNLLVLCVAVRNAGLNDHNLLALLSASVAGSLYGGKGHSLVYEEKAVYDLATRYLFEVSHPLSEPTSVPGRQTTKPQPSSSSSHPTDDKTPQLISEPFEAQRWNPYELPWSLRGLFEDKHVRSLFAEDILGLLEDYEQWNPDAKNKTLKDLQWRLAPMRSIRRPIIEGDIVHRDKDDLTAYLSHHQPSKPFHLDDSRSGNTGSKL